jgi:hypothetical protein
MSDDVEVGLDGMAEKSKATPLCRNCHSHSKSLAGSNRHPAHEVY